MKKGSRLMRWTEIITLSIFALLLAQACQKAEKTVTPAEETAAATIPSPDFYTILGKADAQNSGAFDVQKGEEETLVAYHYYVTDLNNFDKEFGQAIAPKIRELYKQAKDIDRVAFDVYIPSEGGEPWQPYVHFAVNRKIIEETDWTRLLDVDFFQVVLDLKYFD